MKYSLSPDKIVEYILSQYSILFGDQPKEDLTVSEDTFINEFSKNENSIKIIFDIANLTVLSVSDNVESISGYTADEMKKGGVRFWLSVLTLEHLLFPYLWSKWVGDIYKKTGNLDDFKLIGCGIKVKHKNGQVIRGLFRYSPIGILNNTKDGVSQTATISLDIVTHLVKSDFYWMRAEYGLTERHTHHIVSNEKKDYPNDIISDREKDVLRLVAEGMESHEIGKTLFISSNTVNNHRRNMITKTGVRDTTALVQICKMGGII